MAKGASFEREVAKWLSLWWSNGNHDDLVWRTAGSGGRATNRQRAGKATRNAYGDLAATSAEAQPLFDLITFELKVGYPRVSVCDLVDRPDTHAFDKARWDGWFVQAERSAELAKTPLWAVIHRPTSLAPMIYFDVQRLDQVPDVAEACLKSGHRMVVTGVIRTVDKQLRRVAVVGVRLVDLFGEWKPGRETPGFLKPTTVIALKVRQLTGIQ